MDKIGVANRRQGWTTDWLERPVIAFLVAERIARWQRRGLLMHRFRALVDPPREQVDLRWREFFLAWRHLPGNDALVHQAIGMIARFDCRTRIATAEERPC